MALKEIDHGSAEYKMMISLRDEILRKPLGLSFLPEDLEKEKEDILIAFFDDDRMDGCCLLTQIDSQTLRLRQMAVRNSLQGKGIGESIIRFAETLARDRGFRKIIMHARRTAIGFYERCGYNACGDEFVEVTLPHKRMEKWLV